MLDIDKPYLFNSYNSCNLARKQYIDIINKNIQKNIVSTNNNLVTRNIQNTFNTIISNQKLSSIKSSK